MENIRSPFVYWSQNNDNIFLRVDIYGAKDVKTNTSKQGKLLEFSAIDEKGHHYKFSLSLARQIQNTIDSKANDLNVVLTLKKMVSNGGEWNSLIDRSSQRLPVWLKFDFDRWQPDETTDDEQIISEEDQYKQMWNEIKNKNNNNNSNFMTAEEIQKKMNMMYSTYLCAYNVCMFAAHFYVFCTLILGLFFQGKSDYLDKFWNEKFASFVACTVLQYMDVLHSVAGLVKSRWQTTALQVTGRFAMLMIINGNPRIYSFTPVLILMLTYFLGEQFRYPFYALSSLSISITPITWLRYSFFLIFYPIGFLMEGIILFQSVGYYYETGKYGLDLPNHLNFSFNFGVFLFILSVSAFPYAIISLYRHMLKQRSKKLYYSSNDANKKQKIY